MSNKKKAINGIIWTSIELILGKGLGFISTIFIARILSPKDFGIIGMTTIFVGLISALIDNGMTQSLIRKKKVSDIEYSSVFFLNVFLSLVFAGILCLISPYIANFYNVPILSSIIKIYAICIIINTIKSIQITILTRSMNFKKIALLNLPSTLLGYLAGIYFAYNNYGVWSLVYMNVVNTVVSTLLFWLFRKYQVQVQFSFKEIKEHIYFGYKLTIAGILNIIYENVNNILIGKFYPIQKLGLYERSYYFNNYPITIITGIISKVTYPLLSQFHEDLNQLKKVFRKIIINIFFLTTPFFCIISGISTPLLTFLLGKNWLDVILYYKILSLGFILYPIHILHLNLITVMGKSELFLKLEIIKKILGITLTILFFQIGVLGLLWSITIMSYIALIINTYYTKKILKYTYKEQFLDLIFTYITSILVGIIAYFCTIYLNRISIIMNILTSFLISSFLYIIFNIVFKNNGIKYLKETINKKNDISN